MSLTGSNIPTGVQDPGDMDDIILKKCPDCDHGWQGDFGCPTCGGDGQIEMSPDEVREEIENKAENQYQL